MINKEKILEIANKNGRFTTKELSEEFGVSRQYLNQLLAPLVDSKQIYKIGSTRSAFYASSLYAQEHPEIISLVFRKKYRNKSLEEHSVLMGIEKKFAPLSELPENIRSIFTFAFSEMFNNAIEHSGSNIIGVEISLQNKKLRFVVEDSGVGIFRNIMKTRGLASELQAIQDLLKGKTTTMPKSHSGEGIFFTSKSADIFILDSFDDRLVITKENTRIEATDTIKRGTRVVFEIKIDPDRHLADIFRRYTNLTDDSDYGFDKTEIRVKLYTMGGVCISRSQARRVLSGLEKFKIVLLDFDNVPVVGQAFADEIYRVFQHTHPGIAIQEENMTEGVRFMVERAKNEAKKAVV
jgi:anti-sigma regulatory factor (Ser/Thr protein kinase)